MIKVPLRALFFIAITSKSHMIHYMDIFKKIMNYVAQEFGIRIRKHKRGTTIETLKELKKNVPLRLHLGCGREHWDGYINIDSSDNSAADVVMDFRELGNHFKPDTVEEIVLIHCISYLRYWKALEFFQDVHRILKINGKLILEFPDINKCAEIILNNKNNLTQYMEGVRAIFAFDYIQLLKKEYFTTYNFGWAAWHMSDELKSVGFKSVQIKDPQTHNKLTWRDTRIEAIKLLIISIVHWKLFEYDFYALGVAMITANLFYS